VRGDVPALKLALEMSGDYTPRLKQTLDANVKTVPFTSDELGQAEAELKAFEDGRSESAG